MIQINDLSLQRGHKSLLAESQLRIYPGWKVGITGKNGCGKSSLFALLRGKLSQEQGDLDVPKSWQIGHLAQETPQSENSALEYTLAGDVELLALEAEIEAANRAEDGLRAAKAHEQLEAIDGYRARARAGQILHGLGFSEADTHKSVNSFSGGWRMRLNLAQTLMRRSDLLLLDEPTNHLDLDAVLWFETWLARYQGTLLLISHDRDFLDTVVGHIVHVEHQKLNIYQGNYAAFEKQRAEKLAQQQANYEKQQTHIQHLEDFVRRFKAKASKAKQAQSRVKALEKMQLISAAHVDSQFQFEFPKPSHNPTPLINLEKVTIGYGEQTILSKLNLQIVPGMRLGLLGANGAGKSTFIKLLAGLLAPLSGKYQTAKELKIGYFAQHQLELLHPDESPLQHLQRQHPDDTEQALRNFLGGFGFIGDMATAPSAPFSGGEKARLALALLVAKAPNLLLLDEPTNHLDLDMRHALTVALQNYQGALLVVSHDRHLLRATTDQLFLVNQGQVSLFDDDLEAYRQWLLEQNKEPSQTSTQKADKQQQVANRAQKRQWENRLKKIDQRLQKLTEEIEQVQDVLADPELYQDREKADKVAKQDTMLKQEQQTLEEEWLELSESLEA